jgi:hypothetical protein
LKLRRFSKVIVVWAFFVFFPFLNVCASTKGENPKKGELNFSKKQFCFFADFLYWKANESGADNWVQNFLTQGSSGEMDILALNFGWTPGFRSGIDFVFHEKWDTKLAYTWFRTVGSGKGIAKSSRGLNSSFLGNFYINNADGSSISNAARYQRAKIHWSILMNLFDWEMGCKVGKDSALSFRPFFAVKGGWIHQTIRSKWENPVNVSAANAFSYGEETLKNKFCGIGPGGGVDTSWKLGNIHKHSFALFGDFSGAILWGHWGLSDRYWNDHPQTVLILTSHINGGAFMFRAFMGVAWSYILSNERSFLSLRMGYEAQVWLDQLQLYFYDAGRLNNQLTFQGGTLDFMLGF